MIARVFSFIWAANLLTLLVFSIVIYFVDLTHPDDLRQRVEIEMLEKQMAAIEKSGGTAAVQTVWTQIAPVYPSYSLEADAPCSSVDPSNGDTQGCYRLRYSGHGNETLVFLGPIAMPLLLGALMSAIMAIFLSRWVMRPIRAVSVGLKSIAAGNLDTRISDGLRTSNRQMKDLGKDFDFAAEQLQALSEGRTRLFHDISHEIRSPLARLRAAVGLIEVNPARSASLAGRMEGDIARLDHLVNEILTLARLERGEQLGEFQRIELLDLVENIIADANFEGRVRNVTVRYSGADTLELLGDAELLHRACENVIRNALSHTPDGGTVEVRGHRAGQAIVLQVADSGQGVPEEDLTIIFSPFVRVDKATPSPGIGLGLTIASSALHSHGGTITASNRQPHGLLVEIVLPTVVGGPPPEL